MHHAQSQLRAIENGRFVVRSANTGISTIIDTKGNVKEELAPLVDGYIVGEVTLQNETTLYTVIGNTFVYLALIAYTLIVGGDIVKRVSEKYRK